MIERIKGAPGRVWVWLVATLGGLVLLAGVYFSGRSKRKGEVDLAIATRELDRANKEHEAAQAKVIEIRTKQVRLVSDILAEQMKRLEEKKRTQGLTDEQVLDELRSRGDVVDE